MACAPAFLARARYPQQRVDQQAILRRTSPGVAPFARKQGHNPRPLIVAQVQASHPFTRLLVG
jgi:hypothetical protein